MTNYKNVVPVVAQELELNSEQVSNAVELLDDGNTIPFIARYRKEATGSLDETVLREIEEQVDYLRKLEDRKDEVLRLIDEQDELTEELAGRIDAADSLQAVEDLYRPYRPRRQTRAQKARDRGLEPLANAMWEIVTTSGELPSSASLSPTAAPQQLAASLVELGPEVETVEEALQGARDIIAERVADNPEFRGLVREHTWKQGMLHSTARTDQASERSPYEMYFDYQEPLHRIKPHRVLAINRAEDEEVVRVTLELDHQSLVRELERRLVQRPDAPSTQQVVAALEDGYTRLLAPSVERELRRRLTEEAEEHAIDVFADNLEQLLLQAPVRGKTVMGIDPAYRTGCKLAVVDPTGELLETAVMYPTPPRNEVDASTELLLKLLAEYRVDLVAIGNGTASRETEQFVAEVASAVNERHSSRLRYTIVNEAGASVYSASPLASKEFPELDVSERSAVSIARRLQDPLAELVKIEPKSIGVGQYQHDVNQNRLADTLDFVVEKCVNRVGVDLNTASSPLLERVSGIGPANASAIVSYRRENGFENRKALLDVSGVGPKTFEQCAGFLRLPDSTEPLDATAIHPESYAAAYRLLDSLGVAAEQVAQGGLPDIADRIAKHDRLGALPPDQLASSLEIGLPTLQDIIGWLEQPGRDPRQDMPGPLFRSDVLELEDLKPGMRLRGTVRNVVDFGAFVDIGVKRDGLIHISELRDGYVPHPGEVVSVGDIVEAMVLEVDQERERISLTLRGIDQP